MGWLAKRSMPIGVDVGVRFIKAAQLAPSRELGAACMMPRVEPDTPLSAADVRQLQGALYRSGFGSGDIVLAVPNDKLLCDSLELPPRASDAPIDQLAKLELARVRKIDADSLETDCWDIVAPARAARATHVMAVGCICSDAEAMLDQFESEGMVVCALDAAAQALTRAAMPMLGPAGEITGILDIGSSAATLIVLHMGRVSYHRVIAESGLRQLYRALKNDLELEPDVIDFVLAERGVRGDDDDVDSDAGDIAPVIAAHFDSLADELRTSFSYVAQQYPDASITKILVCGGGGKIAGLPEYLEHSLRVAVRAIGPQDVVSCPAALAQRFGPALIAAIGLAQYAV